MRMKHFARLVAGLAALMLHGAPARAEVTEIIVAKQFGISYLPLMLMEADGLIQKHAKTDGIDGLKIDWRTLAGGAPMNDAIISGSLHFASGGVGPLVTLWARTKGTIDVKAVAAMNSMPLYLNLRSPTAKSIADITDKDRIALPAVKVSIQAITLMMAAEKQWGPGQHNKLDSQTIAMSHPDGQAALISGAAEVTGHFSSPPFQYQQLKTPGIRTILSSYDVLGGPGTFNLVWTTARFHKENPRVYAAFLKAFSEAIDAINADKGKAAQRYLDIAKDKRSTHAEILAMLNDPAIMFTLTPQGVMRYADFMAKVGAIKVKPERWQDLFFENAHGLKGS